MKLFLPFVLLLTLLLGIAAFPVASHQLQHSSLIHLQSDTLVPHLPEHPFDYFFVPSMFMEVMFIDPATGEIGPFEYNPTDNPISSEGATLGRVLFYDKQLSVNGTVSCASCHLSEFAFTDTAQLSEGFAGELTHRNSIGLVNARFQPSGHFFWDLGTDTLRNQVQMAIESEVEMGLPMEVVTEKLKEIPYYPPLFKDAYGDEEITPERIKGAIGQFTRSIVSFMSRFDYAFMKSMENGFDFGMDYPDFTDEQNLGKRLFYSERLGCGKCHHTQVFAGVEPMSNGLDLVYQDKGFGAVIGDSAHNGQFKVPSLRNVALTAPYMHDGRFATLEAVIEHYNSGVQAHPNLEPVLIDPTTEKPKRLNLDATEQQALLSFLHTLTDTVYQRDPLWMDPFDPQAPIERDIGSLLDYFFQINQERTNTGLGKDIQELGTIFPNPFKEQLTLSLHEAQTETLNLRLLDMQGRLLFQDNFSGSSYQIPRKHLPAGTYLLFVVGKKSIWSTQVQAI